MADFDLPDSGFIFLAMGLGDFLVEVVFDAGLALKDGLAGDEPRGGETTGDEPRGGETTGDEPTGGETTGDEPLPPDPAGSSVDS